MAVVELFEDVERDSDRTVELRVVEPLLIDEPNGSFWHTVRDLGDLAGGCVVDGAKIILEQARSFKADYSQARFLMGLMFNFPAMYTPQPDDSEPTASS